MVMVFLFLLAPLAAQTINITSPMGYRSHCVGDRMTITWTSSGISQPLTIALRAFGLPPDAAPALVIATGEADDGSYEWTIPATVAAANYYIRVRTDDATVKDDSGMFFIHTSPVITVASPAGTPWTIGNRYEIRWQKVCAMQDTVTIALRNKGSAPDAAPAFVIATGEANDGSHSWTIPGTVAPGEYFIRVRTDDASVRGDSSVFTIRSGLVNRLPPDRLPPLSFQFPRLEVSDIGLAPNAEGFGIIFSYKNTGKAPLPKASDVPVKPSYRVLIDGRETASGSLFIPAFAAPPGWEQTGYFGGWIVMPVNLYDDKLWHIGNIVTVHINENKVMGMDSHTLGLNLKPIALRTAYDVIFTNVSFNWAANELTMAVRVEGKIPPGKRLRFHHPGEFFHDVDIHPGQGVYSYSHKLIYKPPKGRNWIKIDASAYLVPLPGGGERLLDIDLRNNQGLFHFDRPPRPAESPH
jgi:hypothetical protein